MDDPPHRHRLTRPDNIPPPPTRNRLRSHRPVPRLVDPLECLLKPLPRWEVLWPVRWLVTESQTCFSEDRGPLSKRHHPQSTPSRPGNRLEVVTFLPRVSRFIVCVDPDRRRRGTLEESGERALLRSRIWMLEVLCCRRGMKSGILTIVWQRELALTFRLHQVSRGYQRRHELMLILPRSA